jgi:two-component system response regulator FixJ
MEIEPTVFVVDDDPAARDSVAALVASHGLKVEDFASAEEFLAARDPARRGCLIADVRMAGMSGLELQERLVARGDSLPVIIITGFADIPMAVRAMQAGAVTFLEKPCADQELWQSIQVALDSEELAESSRQKRADVIARRESLTPAEVDVLERILAGKPNKLMAVELGVGLRTVELRRATLMKKMRADSLPELVQLVLIAEGKWPDAKPPEGPAGEEPS